MRKRNIILPVIVFAQFCCTSLWFAGNGVINELAAEFKLGDSVLGYLVSAVQLGFISGTLIFSILTISDRFSPSRVFLVCSMFGALTNVCLVWEENTLTSILLVRFLTGFFLAGIYPVGMKIAADYFQQGLGKPMGFLVGALVAGTSFPHLLKYLTMGLPWKSVIVSLSGMALLGGALMAVFIPDGPYRKFSQRPDLSAFVKVFQESRFRAAAFGYFGHMWEVYAFWAFVPVMLKTYTNLHPGTLLNIPLLSFFIIGIGGISCVIGGYLSQELGTRRIAFLALLLSGGCCLVSPLMFLLEPARWFILFLLFWGMVVIADSPLFSTMVAQNAPAEKKGTALTIVTCIGFSLTIISIQLTSFLSTYINPILVYFFLAIGPVLGLASMRQNAPTASK